jgi:hypothetical protein
MMSRKVRGRTVREFTSNADVWEILERWALAARYELVVQDQVSRTYQKGSNPFFVPTFVKLTWENPGYCLETWQEPPGLNRFVSLGTIPRVLGLESGGITGSVPRMIARRDVNRLLGLLGVPLVR